MLRVHDQANRTEPADELSSRSIRWKHNLYFIPKQAAANAFVLFLKTHILAPVYLIELIC